MNLYNNLSIPNKTRTPQKILIDQQNQPHSQKNQNNKNHIQLLKPEKINKNKVKYNRILNNNNIHRNRIIKNSSILNQANRKGIFQLIQGSEQILLAVQIHFHKNQVQPYIRCSNDTSLYKLLNDFCPSIFLFYDSIMIHIYEKH